MGIKLGPVTDPEVRRERAKLGAAGRHSLKTYARRLVADWPDLTEAQKVELRALLAPALGEVSTGER